MTDPIVEEVRRHRDAHARQFNYDLAAICADLKEREGRSGHRVVRLAPTLIAAKSPASDSHS